VHTLYWIRNIFFKFIEFNDLPFSQGENSANSEYFLMFGLKSSGLPLSLAL
jgi:hypothetical protein